MPCTGLHPWRKRVLVFLQLASPENIRGASRMSEEIVDKSDGEACKFVASAAQQWVLAAKLSNQNCECL